MERDRTKPPTPDLFSTHVVRNGSPPIWRASPRDVPADIGVRHHKLQRGGRQWSGKLALGDSADAMTSERNVASSIAAQ
jgi:hypothetical protein